MAKLEQLKKPRSLKGLPGLGAKVKLPALPKPPQPPRLVDLTDNEVARLTLALGDERLAKRVLKLKEKYPDASTLEVIAMEYLDRKQVRYVFQQSLLGGRKIRYGQVTDFIIDKGTYWLVWEMQGQYWHTRKGKPRVDAAQRLALLGITFRGKPIDKVVEVWEGRIVTANRAIRDRTFALAMQGIEVGK